jgi:hypothetical protein
MFEISIDKNGGKFDWGNVIFIRASSGNVGWHFEDDLLGLWGYSWDYLDQLIVYLWLLYQPKKHYKKSNNLNEN